MTPQDQIIAAVTALIGEEFVPTTGQERALLDLDDSPEKIISGFEAQLADICNDLAAPYDGLHAEDIPIDLAAECLELSRYTKGFASNNIYSMVNKLSRDGTLRLGELLGEADEDELVIEIDFFALVYEEIFGREIDPEGREFYEKLEEEGVPVRVLLRDIINSPEAMALDA